MYRPRLYSVNAEPRPIHDNLPISSYFYLFPPKKIILFLHISKKSSTFALDFKRKTINHPVLYTMYIIPMKIQAKFSA